jgi:hypothetical protein
MAEIRRISPLSAAKIAGVLYGIMGLLFIPLFLVIRTFAPEAETGMIGFGSGIAIFIVPVVYACLGFVFTFIAAALYNLIAGIVGGLEVELG